MRRGDFMGRFVQQPWEGTADEQRSRQPEEAVRCLLESLEELTMASLPATLAMVFAMPAWVRGVSVVRLKASPTASVLPTAAAIIVARSSR